MGNGRPLGQAAPEESAKSNGKKWLVVLLIGVIVLLAALAAYFALRRKPVPQPQTIVRVDTVVKEVVVRDTVVTQLEKKFNACHFEQGKAVLSEDAKVVLRELCTYLNENTELNLKVVGHTSSEGNEQVNLKLSEERAKAAVDFLKENGVVAERLSYEGKGSTEQIDPEHPEANRRTEFIISK